MRYLLAIDPGVRALGGAFFRDGTLLEARCSIAREGSLGACVIRHLSTFHGITAHRPDVALELMRIRAKDSRSRPDDLIDVQAAGSALAGACRSRVTFYPPSEWKAGVPKTIHHKRLLGALVAEERLALDCALSTTPKSHHKEILDALGIGLYHLSRTTRGGMPK